MSIPLTNIFSSISSKNILELVFAVLSIAIHILDAKQKLLSRILWFPNLILNIYIFSKKRLYGKVFHSIVNLFINTYAYMQWKGIRTTKPIQVGKTGTKTLFFGIVVSLALSVPWAIFRTKTNTDIPAIAIYSDALYAVLGLFEKFLMSKKRLERWILAYLRYILGTIAMIKINSPILAILCVTLLFVSIYGQYQWYMSYRGNKQKG